ncbi:preprotein translocase subunit YajC [Clostridium botulinum]|uniref:preprotein translocase subunit YajC n=1 Tax=Clostridium TaxID=1485 RepID=UPI0005076FC8|nr:MULTISPECIES: preprotein translocase subunit YajC [unclassified Clostridium]AIY79864.1 preprotein translocase, YajC subunit [Clostridium botulinum 202F]KAI3348381.1 preprotein translocase subunit YajC [Clostridium botulinum]KFX58064.1 preprotein translocase subunit YajC [Clostridium botulinum]KFX58954.1 preprotein translocase subunit YajC [Clostridium botulinum]KON12793.1 preprotein translocase subunit YajC [Clostridium botulinum]
MNSISAILINVLPFLVVFVIFYFLLILPEKKRKKKYGNMISELKVNDEIMTRGGIIGKIVNIDDENVVIETSAAKTKIKLAKSGISYKTNK